MHAEQSIKICIRVISSFKTNDGDYVAQAVVAVKEMNFKNIELISNKKIFSINKNQFQTSTENNLQSKLLDDNYENKNILTNIFELENQLGPSTRILDMVKIKSNIYVNDFV